MQGVHAFAKARGTFKDAAALENTGFDEADQHGDLDTKLLVIPFTAEKYDRLRLSDDSASEQKPELSPSCRMR
jgi:hypothetical protein